LPNTKFVFPTGAPKKTTVFGGSETNSWFDIHTFADRTVGEDDQIPGLSESIAYLRSLVEEEVDILVQGGVERGEARKRIVVAGFSSGAALTVLGMLSGEWEIGGAIGGYVGMSGWLPFRLNIERVLDAAEDRSKILLCHGEMDVKMRYEWGVQMRDTLEQIGFDFHFKSYPELDHWVCGEEMVDVVEFLKQ
ncbi:alpha/beta-hydrolase, partial [Hyaloscypha hepaticicola]